MYSRNYGVRESWLEICVKSPVSGDPLTGNMVKGPNTVAI